VNNRLVIFCVALIAIAGLVLAAGTLGEVRNLKPPAPLSPMGVCVQMNDLITADSAIVATVTQAQIVNGVVSCEAGQYVPVTAK
jgi:hypothetical protein